MSGNNIKLGEGKLFEKSFPSPKPLSLQKLSKNRENSNNQYFQAIPRLLKYPYFTSISFQ